jgi:transcriptional regulator with XRE-family HTH domain
MKFNHLGRFLKAQREAVGMTQGELSRILGYSNPQFISNWERGLSSPPPKIMSRLVNALDINETAFLKIIMDEQRAFWEAHVLGARRGSGGKKARA